MTETLAPDTAGLARAATLLRAGGLVAFATETVYGLGADATDERAVAAIFAAKGRPQFNPLICHYPDAERAFADVEATPPARQLAAAFWPGPLTLVLPRRPDCQVAPLAGAGLATLAVRVPAHPDALALLRAVGRPVAAPSANPSGAVSPTTAAHVLAGLSGRIDAVLDSGACPVGVESTVLDLSGTRPVLLRPGGVTHEALEALLGPVDCGAPPAAAPASPGLLASHYAPSLPVRLDALAATADEALLAFGPAPAGAGAVFQLSEGGDLAEAAARLFAGLRALDASGLRGIAVMPVPATGLGFAINDRLRRAASGLRPEPHQEASPPGPPPGASPLDPILKNGVKGASAPLRVQGGALAFLTDLADTASYGEDWRGLYRVRPLAVARPASTQEVAELVRACMAEGVPVVPQGGNTSMVGGAVPVQDGRELVLSLSRLNRVRAVDPVDLTITVEAGVTLRAAQLAAEAAGCLLPLSIASEGTAQIGGILATNAGGNHAVRYGSARDLVLGLEVVLPDGAVWDGLRRLRKDNTGYCLRQLFVGAEGTLGVITAAVLKLVPRPRQLEVALCALPSCAAALALFGRFQAADPASVQAFEYLSGAAMQLVLRHIPGAVLPLAAPAAHYALVELATPRPGADLRTTLESVLEAALAEALIADAVIAGSAAQRAALWRLREDCAEAQKRAGANVKNDISVPVSRVPELIERAGAACAALLADIRIAPFGHLGDGNIHFNLVQPAGTDPAAFLARAGEITGAVGTVVRALEGSFSAEHGVGQLKTALMPAWRGGAELATMQRIKAALDPLGLMNPGKVLP